VPTPLVVGGLTFILLAHTMPITTTPSVSFVARTIFMAVLLAGFGVWGAYDLWVKIPYREQVAQRFDELTGRMAELEDSLQKRAAAGGAPTQAEAAEYAAAKIELNALSPGGKAPARPSKFDRPVQWIYIACLPFAIQPLLTLLRLRRQRYQLDENGSLHFAGDSALGSGIWPVSEIADIDMHRWMAKSIAWVVQTSGTRLKLDAYLHKNLDLIIGAIASRLHPEQWQPDAKPVKAAEAASAGTSENAGSEDENDRSPIASA
jgi:hypothetical protein